MSAQPPFNPNYNAGWNQPSQHPQQAHAPVQQFGQPLSQPYAMVQQQRKYSFEIPKYATGNDSSLRKTNSSFVAVVIINQQTLFGPDPTMTTCHQCKQSTVSRLEYENSIMTHVLAGVLCVMWSVEDLHCLEDFFK